MANIIEFKLKLQNSSLCVIIGAYLGIRVVPLTHPVNLHHEFLGE